jgi:hypothetical protein
MLAEFFVCAKDKDEMEDWRHSIDTCIHALQTEQKDTTKPLSTGWFLFAGCLLTSARDSVTVFIKQCLSLWFDNIVSAYQQTSFHKFTVSD